MHPDPIVTEPAITYRPVYVTDRTDHTVPDPADRVPAVEPRPYPAGSG
ncbi:hypothetical protein Axi01nite_44120 [Actinoplanes xinjiangensis]|nr:hypothetical protein Axi01nite_44120 [Actinoplanes xinjiangensis]